MRQSTISDNTMAIDSGLEYTAPKYQPQRKPAAPSTTLSDISTLRRESRSGITLPLATSESMNESRLRRESRIGLRQTASVEVQVSIMDSALEVVENQNASLSKEVEELRTKLKLAESRKTDDRDKDREIDKLKQEIAMSSISKSSLNAKLAELQSELKEARTLVKEATAEKNRIEAENLESQEALEMMTLDKEVAEEKADSLQAELELLQEKVDELTIDLEVMKEEQLNVEGRPELSAQVGDHTEMIQLERQNERLKEALIRLRDSSAESEAELKTKMAAMEKEIAELSHQSANNVDLQAKLSVAEMRIEDLKASIDTMLGAEDMVEHLSERNLRLSEQVEELKVSVEDLEALNELNKELEENHILAEEELQHEIDTRDLQIRNLTEKLAMNEESIGDYESTVKKFRELVRSLHSEIEGLNNVVKMSEPGAAISHPEPKHVDIEVPVSNINAQARILDLELRKLEVQEANDHLQIAKNYLPDQYFREEQSSVLSYLLMKRILFKSSLLKTFLEDLKISQPEPDYIARNSELRQRIVFITVVSVRLIGFMENSSPEWFASMGNLYAELQGVEKRLDSLISSVKEDGPLTKETCDDLRICGTQMNQTAEKNIKSERMSSTGFQNWAIAASELVESGISRLDAEIDCLEARFSAPVEDELIGIRLAEIKSAFAPKFTCVKEASKAFRVLMRKLRRKMMDLIEKDTTFKLHEVLELSALDNSTAKLIEYFVVLSDRISSYIKTATFPEIANLFEISKSVCLEVLDRGEDAVGQSATSFLVGLQASVSALSEQFDLPHDKVITHPPPWIERAQNIKAEFTVNADMEKQIESLNDEVLTLVTEVNHTRELNQESMLKIDLLEKKLEGSRSQSAKMANLESRIQRLMEKEREFAEAADHLQEENRRIEQELNQFKRLAKRQEKFGSPHTPKRSLSSKASYGDVENTCQEDALPQFPNSTGMDLKESIELLMDGNIGSQFDALRTALKYLRAENARLKSLKIRETSSQLFIHNDPLMRKHFGSSHGEDGILNGTTRVPGVTQAVLADLARDSKTLVRDLQECSVTAKVVDVARSSAASNRRWSSLASDPHFQHRSQVEMFENLSHRGHDIHDRVKQLASKVESRDGLTTTASLLGKVRVPLKVGSKAIPHISAGHQGLVLTSRTEWQRLHSIFVN